MACVSRAFVGREELERDGDQAADLLEVARTRGAQECFQFGERELDRIEVRTVRREESNERAHLLDRGPHLRLFVDREVVEHDDVAWAQRRHQHLFDVGEERRTIDGPIEHRRCAETLETERGDHRVGLPVTARACDRAVGCRAGCGRSAVTDRSSRRIHRERHTAGHRGAAAPRATADAQRRRRAGVVRRRVPFFLTVRPSRSISRHSVLRAAVVCNASRSSANVASGRAAISARQPILLAGQDPRPKLGLLTWRDSSRFRGGAAPTDGPMRGLPRTSRRPPRRPRWCPTPAPPAPARSIEYGAIVTSRWRITMAAVTMYKSKTL